MGEMNEAEALSLLRSKLGPKVVYTSDEAIELVKFVDFMPLAISQLAANISMNFPRLTISKAVEQLKNPGGDATKLLESSVHETGRDAQRSNSIITTLHLSFQYVRAMHPSAARLLSLMCLFDRQSIPDVLLKKQYGNEAKATGGSRQQWRYLRQGHFKSIWRKLPRRQQKDITVAADFEHDWRVLTDFALIKTNLDGCTFSMHRIVQQAAERWLEINGESAVWKKRFVTIFKIVFPVPEYDTWTMCSYLLPHAQRASAYRPDEACELRAWAILIQRIAEYSQTMGNRPQATEFGWLALSIFRVTESERSETLLDSLEWMANFVCSLEQMDIAENFRRAVYEGRCLSLGPYHDKTMDAARTLNTLLFDRGKIDEGEEMQSRYDEIRASKFGESPSAMLDLRTGLVLGHLMKGRYADAEYIQRRICGLAKDEVGVVTEENYEKLSRLAAYLNLSNRAEEAEGLLRQIVPILEKRHGPQHWQTIRNTNQLGEALAGQKRWVEAAAQFHHVIENHSCKDSQACDEVQEPMHNYGLYLLQQGRLKDAEEIAYRVITESKTLYGGADGSTFTGIDLLASILKAQGRGEEAEALYAKISTRMEELSSSKFDSEALQSSLTEARRRKKFFLDAEAKSHKTVDLEESDGSNASMSVEQV